LAPYMFNYEGHDDIKKSSMHFGFQCNDGWYKILEDLILKIATIDTERKMQIVCIKEKFGTLRFYIEPCELVTKEMVDVIEQATQKSSKTCENCGMVGTLDWNRKCILTLCEDCKQLEGVGIALALLNNRKEKGFYEQTKNLFRETEKLNKTNLELLKKFEIRLRKTLGEGSMK
jgi:hypothetical protein